MKAEIIKLDPADLAKCGNIWDVQKQSELTRQLLSEMKNGIRTTYIYLINGEFIGEISAVSVTEDPDYTVPGKRLYISRLIVKDEYRRNGIGKKLTDHVIEKAKADGYRELSIGVNLDNFAALKLYHAAGFDRVLFVGEDEWGKYMKLMKVL